MSQRRTSFFDTNIEYIRGLGPTKAELLNKELSLFTYRDFIEYYPFRHEDRTQFHRISELNEAMFAAQIKGRLRSWERIGEGSKERLVAQFTDGTGIMELTWFQGITFMEKSLRLQGDYIVYGKPALFGSKWQITHPEMDILTPENERGGYFQPVYSLTEKLRKRYIDSKQISRWMKTLLEQALPYIRETLPHSLVQKFRLISKQEAIYHIHLPINAEALKQARRRLKFEELFYNQFRLIKQKLIRREDYAGQIFTKTQLLTEFYQHHLPFDLTNAQKRVIREIFQDLRSGKQMNRLLQGDVGSGKTIVAFITMLLAIDNGAQACLMAPTEILSDQHYTNLKRFADLIGIQIAELTGSVGKKARRNIDAGLQDGSLNILVGTHALLEDHVQFNNLGLCIIDEQHRFGVAQRAKLWEKNPNFRPHILVMTATPIPRTLAMTLYGDLDISIIDELPSGRKPIKTIHRYDSDRLRVFEFLRTEILKGRQVYIVYPLIEESETLSIKNLMDGYESIARAFPEYALSIVHGKMGWKEKDYEMQRFKNKETQILVATTVIEVGVDVPNASVMLIENANRFGLSQLHQLRGRVGRGAEQSYCILMTDYKLSKETRTRIETMVRTNNGFEISEVDLSLRGPGDMAGTQQSGMLDLKVADLAKDGEILKYARESAVEILENDPDLQSPDNAPIRSHIEHLRNNETNWSRIS
ncbi:ATP-dependent DNA helicase RecG [Emticicia sp. 17c]|uniref:ATP-dependent DNA helicase RecG n=1 Tax=Emticicia sp. 17c TaxID=3127704 RepID=UPI00301B872B